jgi:glycosyltransferase involved in cell wall biosynthesis
MSQDGSAAAGSFVDEIANNLSKHIRVSVLAPGLRNEIENISPNLTVYRYKTSGKPLSNLLSPLSILSAVEILFVLFNGNRLAKLICEKNNIDHILAFWTLPCGWWARSAAKKYATKYSIWALGSDIWSLSKIPIVKRALFIVLRDAHNQYADGFELSSMVNKLSGDNRCTFLPSSRMTSDVPIRKTTHKSSELVTFSFVGRWHSNKGIDILLDSLLLLSEKDWRQIKSIVIAGGGPLEDVVLKKVSILQSANRPVSTTGYLEKEYVLELFGKSDYVFIPSRIESIPLVLTDAVISGSKVIAMPVGDLELLVSKFELGIISKCKDTNCYSEAIREALDKTRNNPINQTEYLHLMEQESTINAILSLV